MRKWIAKLQKGYGRKLHSLHAWNGWIVVLLAVTGLLLLVGFWRGVLGEGRVWVKWAHIVIGLISIVPVLYYLALAGKHWRQLKDKPWQRFNVLVVLGLLLGWFVSGVLLWQFRAVGPAWSNAALLVHDLLTWIGLPYIIYHSITRTKWLKEPHKRTVKSGRKDEGFHPASQPQPLYTRQTFIRYAIGIVIVFLFGPSFVKWIGQSLGPLGGGVTPADLAASDANRMVPAPTPLPASLPPQGGGSRGSFRIYTVTPIPKFDNANWSFTVDGLVDKPLQYDWKAFVALSRTVQVSDFHCVTGWSVYDNTWEGIPLKQFLQQAGVRGGASHVKFYSGDGTYTDSLTMEQAQMDDVMVAVLHDGKLIPGDLGGPVRLIVPKMYAYKSVKWLTRIELIDKDHTGYWELRGYDKNAWV
jgi:DMSO/TMAO reductase YedYZ molybdopterin-dependent catalytic subunit